MKRFNRSVLTLFCLLLAGCAAADEPARVADLAWMAGEWSSRTEKRETEELWMPPKGGLMLGLHREVSTEGRAFFEYLRIEDGDAGPVYLASPRGSEPTPFTLVEHEKGRAVFANPDHDWPKRITYRLEKDGQALCAEVEGDEGDRKARWCWDRVGP